MAGAATVVESIHLEYHSGSSDKEYHLYLLDHGGQFTVHAEFGRRGKAHQRSEKGTFRTRFSAQQMFSKFESEKRGKGYSSMGITRPPMFIPNCASAAPAAPPPAPVFDAVLLTFNSKLAAYVGTMSADELSAGRTATARAATNAGVSKAQAIDTLPSYTPLVAMLGAIAFASEDYIDDAVELGTELMVARTISRKVSERAFSLMNPALSKVLGEVLADHPRTDGVPGLVKHLFQKGKESWFA
jgi:predicted DNA-binding WGR domain protein